MKAVCWMPCVVGVVIGCLLAFPVQAQNPVNEGAIKSEMYLWNRFSDFMDLFRVDSRDEFKSEGADLAKGFKGNDPARDDDEANPNVLRQPARQLGRGISNLAVGVLEVPKNIHSVNEDDGGVAALTYGTARGVWRFAAREAVGVLEIVTFPFGWEPIIEPEFLLQPTQTSEWKTNEPPFMRDY